MKKSIFLILASVFMILIGILRGIGGVFLVMQGSKVDINPPVLSNDMIAKLCGAGLILVMSVFIYSSYLLLSKRTVSGWKTGWVGIILFLVGGLINGYLLFENPFVQDQIVNIIASMIIGACLLLGRKDLARETPVL